MLVLGMLTETSFCIPGMSRCEWSQYVPVGIIGNYADRRRKGKENFDIGRCPTVLFRPVLAIVHTGHLPDGLGPLGRMG